MKKKKENKQNRAKEFFSKRWLSLKTSFTREFIEPKKSEVLKSIFWIILGNLLLSLGAALFLVPGDINTGGTSGIAITIDFFYKLATGQNLNTIIDIKHIITICTIFFFILGYILLGAGFSLKTLISTIVYPVGLYLFDYLREVIVINGKKIFYLEDYWKVLGYDKTSVIILAGIFGGMLMGAGVAFSFKGGGSTGGTDCIPVWLNRKFHIPASIASFFTDFVIIFTGLFASQDLIVFLTGLVGSLLCSLVIERVFSGNSSSYCAEIISSKYREISDAINTKLIRGTTIYEAEGGYTGATRKVVKVSFTRSEYREIIRLIKSIDKYAFITITNVEEMHGNGFSYLVEGEGPLNPSSSYDTKKVTREEIDKDNSGN